MNVQETGRTMVNLYEHEAKKDPIVKACFYVLVEKGIDDASMRDFSNAVGMNASGLYYWFNDKVEIVCQATRWGLDVVIGELFKCVETKIGEIEELREQLLGIVDKYKKELRLIFQVIASPNYSDKLRENLINKMPSIYDECARRLEKKSGMDYDELYPYVCFFGSSIVDAVIWDDWEKFEMESNWISKKIEILIRD